MYCKEIGHKNSDKVLEIGMTLDELIENETQEIQDAINEVIENAGTSDADWNVLLSAGELIAKYKAFTFGNTEQLLSPVIPERYISMSLVKKQAAEIEKLKKLLANLDERAKNWRILSQLVGDYIGYGYGDHTQYFKDASRVYLENE